MISAGVVAFQAAAAMEIIAIGGISTLGYRLSRSRWLTRSRHVASDSPRKVSARWWFSPMTATHLALRLWEAGYRCQSERWTHTWGDHREQP